MKIERLAEDQIKITITLDDLASRNIDLYSFMYNSPESQDLFWDVMNEAEKEYGFNVDDSMIYVEASTSGAGNFTLIVTKTKEKPVIKFSASKQQVKKEKFKLKRKKRPAIMKNSVYEFHCFDDICAFCKVVDCSLIGENSLFKMNNTYFLKSSLMPYTSIVEFATILRNPRIATSKLSEYGETIIQNDALQTISKFFNKKKSKKKL